MLPRIGIVGCSFGLRDRDREPGPSNRALGSAVQRAISEVNFHDCVPVVVLQWEIAKSLDPNTTTHIVQLRNDGSYLDSRTVLAEADEIFKQEGVSTVIVIAQPFLHLRKLKSMVAKDGYDIGVFDVGRIPFDNTTLNTQPWTRSRLALSKYAMRTVVGVPHGHHGRQSAS